MTDPRRLRTLLIAVVSAVALIWFPPVPAMPIATAAAATPQIDLGRLSLNGKVAASVIDASTGVTYLGGDFTEVGERTGSVAVVQPPGGGNGDRVASPEVVGTVEAVFGDDRPSDPGMLVVGRLTAINGAAVPESPIFRLHLVAGRWILDPTFSTDGDCGTGGANFPSDMRWIATPDYIIGGGQATIDEASGIMVYRRSTGQSTNLGGRGCDFALLPGMPKLPNLAQCAGLSPCYARVGSLAYDEASHRLIASYGYIVKRGSGAVDQWDGLAAFDLTPSTGKRLWLKDVGSGLPLGPPTLPSWVTNVGTVPDGFLVQGRFPLDPAITDEASISRLMTLDPATGTIRQRWNTLGEQDADDGHHLGSAGPCLTGDPVPTSSIDPIPGGAVGWVNGQLCRYNVVNGDLAATGSVSLPRPEGVRLPSVYYAPAGGHPYLVGSEAAVDLQTGSLTSWAPEPGVTTRSQAPSVAVVAGGIALGGDFTFLRGTPAPGLVALGPDLARVSTFVSPLQPPVKDGGVTALALTEGNLIVGGRFLLSDSGGGVVALDAASGMPWPWNPDAPIAVDDIETMPDGSFWIAGFAGPSSPGSALQHYGPLDEGGALLAAPTFSCLDVPTLDNPEEPLCAPEWQGRTRVRSILADESGGLYVAGVFGTIDGVARRGLARIAPGGTVDAWNPDLYGVLPMSSTSRVTRLRTDSMILLGGRLVVGGLWESAIPNPAGGWSTQFISPLLVFSISSGALELPSTADRAAWFETPDWFPEAHAMAHTDAGLFVALGDQGMAVFDATTLELDASASTAFLSPSWWSRDGRNGFYTLALPAPAGGSATASARSSTLATTSGRMVAGGLLPRWKLQLAGNVLRAGFAADTTKPTTSAPIARPRAGTSLGGSNLPMWVGWHGSDPHGSGVARYELAMSRAGGAWQSLGTTLSRPVKNLTLVRGVAYRFRVRAIDYAGNVGSWTYGPTSTTSVIQQSSSRVRFSSGWATVRSSVFSGGSARKRSVAGATATYTFTGRAVGIISPMSSGRGRFKVYVDGHYLSTVDLRSSTTRAKVIVWQKTWSSRGTHTLRIVVSGTAHRPRVDLDAFVVAS